MSDAQTILAMIEQVDPADIAKLDEIDARVWCFIAGRNPEGEAWAGNEQIPYWKYVLWRDEHREYSRSRDALRSIRPAGFQFIDQKANNQKWAYCELIDKDGFTFKSPDYKTDDDGLSIPVYLPTEEVAELHVIIQALAYERGQR